jgi:hypothetical protein
MQTTLKKLQNSRKRKIKFLSLKATKLNWSNPRYSADRLGDICQEIVNLDQLIKHNQLVSNNNIKGSHGHDITTPTNKIEVKGVSSFFVGIEQRRIKFLKDSLPSSDTLAIVIIDPEFEFCHVAYCKMSFIKNWFVKHPKRNYFHPTVSRVLSNSYNSNNYYFGGN